MKKTKPRMAPPSPTASALPVTDSAPAASATPPAAVSPFPIVGIGASAGGLEALEQFLSGVPAASGMAYVVVQHLDPHHKGILCELLQRSTPMPVEQITDRTTVQANHVYVIPPNSDLSLLNGVLHLLEPLKPHGLRLPIDFFLRSLALDQRERSIGVILSGMGSDGTLGLRAIKECGGTAFVQRPDTAKFDSMPRSAVEAGLADVVVPPEELATKIIAFLNHVPPQLPAEVDAGDPDRSGLEKIVVLLRTHTGHDFSLYKKNTLYRRIQRRMALHQLNKIGDYVRYLRANPQETQLLFKELLIGVTHFFRDPEVWEQLRTEVIPTLLATHPDGGTLRAWVPACSTGEEAYTLAIVFKEALAQLKPSAQYVLQIFATDLDEEAIEKARAGVYPANIGVDLGEERLQHNFVQDHAGYRVTKDIREMVIFAPQNLVMDPPFTKLDFLSCRNLLIYLEAELQSKVLPLFHYSLNPGGVLVLGTAETVGTATALFAPLPGKNRIYRRRETAVRSELVDFPAAFAARRMYELPNTNLLATTTPFTPSVQTLTDALLLQRYAPAAVLTNDKGDIVYISGKTGKYLEPAAGKANLNLFAMAREGLAGPLNEAFARAIRQHTVIELKALKVGVQGSTQIGNVTVQPLTDPAALRGMVLVVFSDVDAPTPPARAPGKTQQASTHERQLAALAQELQQSREELQTAREEMQTSQEELKSTNEELQSTNEELQSTNEELTTSKEEMQSMNEELHTVNHELNAKVQELSQASDDMNNLLNSTDIATLFLDQDLRVRRYTTQTTSLIKLIPGDAGRPITDLVTSLDYPTLADEAREVLRTLVFHEAQVAARDGRWFSVRTMPYRTQDNRIDGVVITFTDISASKALETALREAMAGLQTKVNEQATKQEAK